MFKISFLYLIPHCHLYRGFSTLLTQKCNPFTTMLCFRCDVYLLIQNMKHFRDQKPKNLAVINLSTAGGNRQEAEKTWFQLVLFIRTEPNTYRSILLNFILLFSTRRKIYIVKVLSVLLSYSTDAVSFDSFQCVQCCPSTRPKMTAEAFHYLTRKMQASCGRCIF